MIVPLAPEHAQAAARLHIAGQPGTFLTALGPDVLNVLYTLLPQSTVGFGFAAVDGDATDDVGAMLGFVSATTSVGRLFTEMGTRRLGAFAPALLRRYAQQPHLIMRSVQTALYPLLVHTDGADDARDRDAVPAELLSIMVASDARGRGIGGALMAQLVQACCVQGIGFLDVTVDAANDGARRFYARHQFELRKEFSLYGRTMCLYRRILADDLTGDACG